MLLNMYILVTTSGACVHIVMYTYMFVYVQVYVRICTLIYSPLIMVAIVNLILYIFIFKMYVPNVRLQIYQIY